MEDILVTLLTSQSFKGWLNKFAFIPIFAFLAQFFPFGIAIILLTIAVKLILSPITYKSFVSQAKMKVLRPEIQEINERVKDPMKRQQETMALYSKAGVNPMAGCIPALLQLPVFYALFQFFPSVFDLRQKNNELDCRSNDGFLYSPNTN